jgi:hypothetical protein
MSSTVQPNILAVSSRMSSGVITRGVVGGRRSARTFWAISSESSARFRLE